LLRSTKLHASTVILGFTVGQIREKLDFNRPLQSRAWWLTSASIARAMEAGTNLAKLGLPVANVVRIRPLLPDEPRAGEIRVTDNQRKIVLAEPGKLQGTADDEYYADYCYVDGSFADLYERSLVPLVVRDANGFPGFVDGVNC